MSILLPDVSVAVARHRLHALLESIQELEKDLGKLSIERHLLLGRQQSCHSPERPQSILLQPTAWIKRAGANPREPNEALQAIDTQLQAMFQRHRRLSFSLEIYREILAPISRIPYEILEQIFLHTLPSGFVEPDVRQSPLLLTMICEKWRTIAFSMPLLWSSLSTTSDWPHQVFRPQPSPSHYDRLTRFIQRRRPAGLPSQPQRWIERAGKMPFHMEITIPKQDHWFGIADPYYHWVVRNSDGWFHLRLVARSVNLALLLSKPMVRLEKLELAALYDRDYDIFMLRTYQAEFDLHPETFSFPWRSLTTLEAPETWFIVDQMVAILKGSPNLRSCRAKIQDLYTIHAVPYLIPFHLTHSSLSSLSIFINDRSGYPLRRLLDSLTLTSLVTFNITALETARSHWPHTSFVEFSQRSSQSPLRALRVTGFSMFPLGDARWLDRELMKEICLSFPTLETFTFS